MQDPILQNPRHTANKPFSHLMLPFAYKTCILGYKKKTNQKSPKITSETIFYRKKKENLFKQSFKKKMTPSKQTERLAWLLRAGENKGCCMTINDSPTPIIPPQHSYLLSPAAQSTHPPFYPVKRNIRIKTSQPRPHFYFQFITAVLKAVSCFNSVLFTTWEFNHKAK